MGEIADDELARAEIFDDRCPVCGAEDGIDLAAENDHLKTENADLKAKVERLRKPHENRPPIVCLCGSTRFMEAFFEAGWQETLAGKIVLSVGVCKHADANGAHGAEMLGPEVVKQLDELHLRKIDLADEVLILNVGGYIGESTGNELEYAKQRGKKIRFLEPESAKAQIHPGSTTSIPYTQHVIDLNKKDEKIVELRKENAELRIRLDKVKDLVKEF